jgi:NitT/TauT family transport system permease protein
LSDFKSENAALSPRVAEIGKLRPKRFNRETAIALGGLALTWQILALLTPDFMIPGWEVIFQHILQLNPSWIALTTLRVLVSIMFSFVVGFTVAVLLDTSPRLQRYADPLLNVVMAVPVICWILFAVLWFRGVEFRIFFVLFVVCCPVFLVDMLNGMKGIPADWKEMVHSLRPKKLQYLQKLTLPAVLPAALTSWKVNLSLAIRVVTIAELVGATSGIGYGLVVAQGQFSIADIFAWTLVLVVILLLTQFCISYLEDRFLNWRDIA